MKSPQQIIDELLPAQKAQIVLDFEEFRNEIRNDDSELRRVAKLMADTYGTSMSTWLYFVGHAVAHDMAREYARQVLGAQFPRDLQSAVDSLESNKSSSPKLG